MKRTYFCFAILVLAVIDADARRFASGPFELAVYPANAAEPTDKYSLVPSVDARTNADAVPLYEKAVQAMPPGRTHDNKVREWLKLPAEQLPQKQVEEVVGQYAESLKLMAQAARCKQCNWPKYKPGTMAADLTEYRSLSFLLELRARLEIVRGRYDEALLTMQTAFELAGNLGKAPTCTQAMIGSAIGGMMCKEVELFIQGKDSPNLYSALAGLPRPLADVKNAIESDRENLKAYNLLVRRQFEKQLKPAHDRMLLIAKRVDNNLNAARCVEAIRHYAATHGGRLPEKLSDISDLELPKDVMCDKAFKYELTAKGALLESEMPKGGDAVDTVRYQIVLKKLQ